MNINYTTNVDNVDWQELVDDLEKDNFNNGRTSNELELSFCNSQAVAFAWSGSRVIGKARALSDGVCNAYVVDVWTQSKFRRKGIATTLMNLVEQQLDGQHIYLFTHDAAEFYKSVGYTCDNNGSGKVIGKWLKRE